uniref:Uncharacterized protein n=1 Tax=Sphaerodactylus townsendi TaxID=933632 RepID=A0ACB8FSU2_9SAUR
MVLPFVLGVTGNGLKVIFITRLPDEEDGSTPSHLLNLAISLTSPSPLLFTPLRALSTRPRAFTGPLGGHVQVQQPALAIVNVHASIYLLMVIKSIDRCIFCGYAPVVFESVFAEDVNQITTCN